MYFRNLALFHGLNGASRHTKRSSRGKKRAWPRIIVTAVFATATIVPASATLPRTTVAQGLISATFNLAFNPTLPAGSSISCSVSLISNDVRSPTDSKYVSVTATGTTGTCKLNVPFKWVLASASSTMTIAYSVSSPNHTASAIYDNIAVPTGTTSITIAATL